MGEGLQGSAIDLRYERNLSRSEANIEYSPSGVLHFRILDWALALGANGVLESMAFLSIG